MKTTSIYALAIAPLATLAVAGSLSQLPVAVLFWGTVAGGVHCLAVLTYDLARN